MIRTEARRILDARLVAGEIDVETYNRLRAALETKKHFLLWRVWRGGVSLPITFWVWGGLSGIIASIIGILAQQTNLDYKDKIVAALVSVPWTVFISVSVFRSASAYKKLYPRRQGWGWIAQFLAVLWLLELPGAIGVLSRTNDALDIAVADANKGGSHIVDTNVRFDYANRDGQTLMYNFTILGQSHVPSSESIEQTRTKVAMTLCSNQTIYQILMNVEKITYHYVNEMGQQLMSYDVSRQDCVKIK